MYWRYCLLYSSLSWTARIISADAPCFGSDCNSGSACSFHCFNTDGDDTEYRELIQGFVDWSLWNNLQINAGKTKELVVDFRRRNNPPPAPVNILGTDVDVVESYKRLRSFGVLGPLLRTFYDSVVGSAIFYGIVCWSSSIRDRKRMDRLVRRASSVLGCPLDSMEVVGNGRVMAKLSSMLNNTSHPLQDTLTALGSSFSERLLHPRCVKRGIADLSCRLLSDCTINITPASTI
ncbi:hypothetical protein D4764_12G0010600 [Takifugu flavidus]|uniref:Alkylated DNA repair protein AlkB homologue 8 N-terminal domain-containing protein n=1 Tax=Takifugu flavidus TaxID=433684 RepID=A0A5C6PHE1_9TELE|nr:hypothetical protein D4764_12G0010600 [Takifugu flavidus]